MREPPKLRQNSGPEELLAAVAEIARVVPQTSAPELATTLGRILDVVRFVTDLRGGAISLFDYISDAIYVNSAPGETELRSGTTNHPSPGSSPSALNAPDRSVEPVPGSARSSLLEFPLLADDTRVGCLTITYSGGDFPLEEVQNQALELLSSLAAAAIDRCRLQVDSPTLLPWLRALTNIWTASLEASGKPDFSAQEMADCLRTISGADLVVLYEYAAEAMDVRLPPTFSGTPRQPEVLAKKGVIRAHQDSVIFSLVNRGEPIFAEAGPQDWFTSGLMSEDAATSEDSFFARESIESSAGIPLMVEAEPVGVLFLNYRRPVHFDPDLQARLGLIANQVALAIGNKRFFQRSTRIGRNLELLNRIGSDLSAAISQDIETIGRLLDDHIRRLIPTKNFFLCLYDREREQFTLPYLRDQRDPRKTLEPRLHEGLTGLLCRDPEHKLLLLKRADQQELFRQGKAKLVGQQSAVWLGAPLVLRGNVIGAIVVQDFTDEDLFNSEHTQLFSTIASQAAIAIDNHRLLDDAHVQLKELATLLELSQASVRGELTAPGMLSSILSKLCGFASGDGSLLLLVDPGDKDKLRIAATSRSLERYLGKSLHRGEGVAGEVLDSPKPRVINDYLGWPNRLAFLDPPPRKVCAVPLALGDDTEDTIGVLTLSSDTGRGQFGRREIEMLQRFAGPLTIAVQRTRELEFRKVLIDAGPYAIIAVDRRGHVTEFNAEASKLFEYSEERVQKIDVATLYREGKEEAHRIHRLLKAREVIRDEETFGVTRSGQMVPLSLSAALLRDGAGSVIGSVGVMEDLRLQSLRTRTQLLVEALRELSDTEDLNSIVDRVLDSSLTLLYADAGCLLLHYEGRFEVACRKGVDEEMTAILCSSLVLETLEELVSGDPLRIAFPIEEGKGDLVRLTGTSKSSVVVPVHTEHRLLAYIIVESRQENHFRGEPQLLRVLASQAAVSINRVELLEYREKTLHGLMVSANAITVGEITTSFIHEAGNSLNSMNLLAKDVSEDIESETDLRTKKSEYLDRLGTMQSEISRFGGLARRLQRFTQHGLRPEKTNSYLNVIVEQTLETLESILRDKKIRCEPKLAPKLGKPRKGAMGTPILVDQDQIQQVLMNLILNAVAASNERQPLVVETQDRGDEVACVVKDYGSGIPDDIRVKLFQPFFTTKDGGVGLGLYLSRILIEDNHGGSIEIEDSSPGKGSTFTIRLPKGK